MDVSKSAPPFRLHQEAAAVHPAAKLRVHLVDDNQDAVDSLAKWMSLAGYEIRVSYSGPQALQAAQEFRPDVMLIDIMLPGMDGYELAACLRGQAAFQNVTFIAVTGLADQDYPGRRQDAKFNLHFAKPVDLDMLQSVLASVAKKKKTSA